MTISNLDHLAIPEVSFMVIDFEGVTHKGKPIEPVELGAMRIIPPGVIDADFEFEELICPPANLPVTAFFSANTGIRAEDIVGKPPAETVLARFDRHVQAHPHVMVAQNAYVEAGILIRHTQACPWTAQMPFIDTLALARYLLPPLRAYSLDALATHFALPIPANRHRALADVRLTCAIFLKLLALWKERHKDWSIYQLRRVAGINTAPPPTQPSLFG